jgi:thiazole/oxazole-forming peptide maturase SagD family component
LPLRGSDKPRLARSSLILPSPSGWMIRSGSEIVEVRSKPLARAGDALLDLFDGSHTLGAIARQSGVRLQELEWVTRRLSRLRQLEAAPKNGPFPKQRRPSLGTSSRVKHSGGKLCPLLLVGLGELGLTVLDQLLQYGPRVVYIFDPVPVENGDIAPFYRPGELGRMKVDVVWRCLGQLGQSIVQRVKSQGGEREEITATLGQVVGKVGVVLCCVDRASQLAECVSAVCETARAPLVVAELLEAGGAVGPIRSPDGERESGGCISCASLHRAEGDHFLLLEREYLRQRFPLPVHWRPEVDPWLIEMISHLALLAAFQAGDRASNPATNQSIIWQLASEPFEVVATAAPKHYACTQCFPMPGRTSAELRKKALRDWRQHWNRPATEPVDLLELRRRSRHLIGERFAVFRSCARESADQRQAVYRFCRDRGANPRDNLVANAFRAVLERPGRRSARTTAFSEGSDFHDGRRAEALALMEGIERLFALEYSDPRRVLAASYQAVAGCALDPTTFPLYAAQQYAQLGLGLRKFDPGQCIEWIWGVRVSDSEPVLVPLDLVFARRQGPRLYRANSNGAACHSSLHHAVLGAIYETIERDSLMVVWMNRLLRPVLDSSSAAATVAGVRRDFEALSLELTCVDITTDLDIPVMLGVLTDKLNQDFLLVNPVASLSRQQLDRKLGREMTQFCRPYLIDRRCYTNRVSASSNPESVKSLPDHLKFYQNREKIRHARFLTSGPNRKDGMHPAGASEPSEVQEELNMVVDRLSRRGYEVIVVDCSVPMIRDLGLHVVKVLIPGLQPLHAGHRYAALGGERLYQVPRLMGLARRDRRRAELNPWPHPFW